MRHISEKIVMGGGGGGGMRGVLVSYGVSVLVLVSYGVTRREGFREKLS